MPSSDNDDDDDDVPSMYCACPSKTLNKNWDDDMNCVYVMNMKVLASGLTSI